MHDAVRVRYQYTPAEHAAALASTGYRRLFRIFFRTVGGYFGLLATAATSAQVLHNHLSLSHALSLNAIGFGLSALFGLGVPAAFAAYQVLVLRARGYASGAKDRTMVFAMSGFSPGAQPSDPLPWSSIARIKETKEFLLLYPLTGEPYYLPTHALSGEARAELAALLHSAFEERPRPLRLSERAT